MTEEPQERLTPEQRRAFIRTQISLTDWYNKSGSQILQELRERGYGINTADFYAIQREKRAPTVIQEAFEQLGGNDTIPVSFAQSKPGWNLSNDYLFQFLVVGRNPEDNSRKVSFFALSSKETLGKDEALDKIRGMIEQDEQTYGITPEDVTLYDMFTRLEV